MVTGMISTGVESLDGRLGGLRRGELYAFLGPSTSGKSLLALHFLLDGLGRGETCVLVTPDEPAMIDSRAAYLGHVGRLTEHPGLTLLRFPDRLPASLAGGPAEGVGRWLAASLGSATPARVVLDGFTALPEYERAAAELVDELGRYLRRNGATAYVLLHLDGERNPDAPAFQPLLQRAAGTFLLSITRRGERTFSFHASPPGAYRTEPFPYSLRIGAGFTEDLSLDETKLTPEERRRIVVLDEAGVLPGEVLAGLEQAYDLELLRTVSGALGTLTSGRYGALVLAVDPFDETRAFDLVYAIRREGNAAPVVCVAPSRGLRSTTRSRGLRAGADDFFVADLPPAEVLERIQMAWLRGTHRRTGLSQIGQIVQPVNGDGTTRPMTRPEFLQAMATLVAEQPPLFFCYLEFTLAESTPQRVWPFLRSRVRIGDGDIIGVLSERRIACALDRISPEQTWRVVERVRAAHPALSTLSDVVVIASPTQTELIRQRLEQARGTGMADAVGALTAPAPPGTAALPGTA